MSICNYMVAISDHKGCAATVEGDGAPTTQVLVSYWGPHRAEGAALPPC